MGNGNWLDNMIGFISPEWGIKREAWRQSLNEYRNYDAGNNERLNSGWRTANESADITDRYQRDAIRARARDLERNSDLFNSVIGAFKRNVIGGGYRLQARTENNNLNDELEELWKNWCKKRNCDITGTQSFNQMLRMIVKRKKVDGGIFIIKRYTKEGYLPLKLQLLEVDELDSNVLTPNNKKNRVVGGIEYNSYNRPVGYWFRQYDIEGYQATKSIYVKADNVIFCFTKNRPSQLREMSDMSQTIPRIRDANEFMVAVSVKERILACLSVFVKKALPVKTGAGRLDNNAFGGKSYSKTMLAPGMITEMNQGDEIQTVNPSGQATDATSYTKLQEHLISAGQGLSYEAVSRDMSQVNYSSARQGAIEDELTYAEEKELIEEIMDEVYESVIVSAVLAGRISIPDFWQDKYVYFKHEWIRAPKKWIDPVKEANATKIALDTGEKTFKQIAEETGHDWQEQINDMAEVYEYAKEKGIKLGGVMSAAAGETK